MCKSLSYQEQEALAGAFGVPSTSSSREKEVVETTLLADTVAPTSMVLPPQKQHQQEEDEDPHDTMITFLTGRTKSERTSKERSIIFPVKLMYVLQCGKYNHIVNWKVDSEHNEHHFIVQDIDKFTNQVLPLFFKVTKYESFQRKLYRWGFIKTRRSRAEKMIAPTSVCYVHPCFRQGDYNSAAQMTCSGASVEICKSTQKHRKRQQRQKGSNTTTSKKQRTSVTVSTKREDLDQNKIPQQQSMKMITTTEEQQHAVGFLPSTIPNSTATAMTGLDMQIQEHSNFATFPQTRNMNTFMMMNPCLSSRRNDTVASAMHSMPTLRNTHTMSSIICDNKRIQDDSFNDLISRGNKFSTFYSNAGSSCDDKMTSPEDADIPKLLARARTQRQIKRIQINHLMREQMLNELQKDFSMEDLQVEWPGTNLDASAVAGTDTLVNPLSSGMSTQTLQASLANKLTKQNNDRIDNNINQTSLQSIQAAGNGGNNTMNYSSYETKSMHHQQIINDAFNALMRSS